MPVSLGSTPGTCLALSHITADGQDGQRTAALLDLYEGVTDDLIFRDQDGVQRVFDGLDLVRPYPGAEPDVAWCNRWGGTDPARADITGSWLWVGVGRKNAADELD